MLGVVIGLFAAAAVTEQVQKGLSGWLQKELERQAQEDAKLAFQRLQESERAKAQRKAERQKARCGLK